MDKDEEGGKLKEERTQIRQSQLAVCFSSALLHFWVHLVLGRVRLQHVKVNIHIVNNGSHNKYHWQHFAPNKQS